MATSTSATQNRSVGLAWLLVPGFLIVVVFLIAQSSLPSAGHPYVSTAMTLDLVLTIPLIYWLIIRRTNIPSLSTIPVFVLGVILAGLLVPASDQQFLSVIRTWVLPVVEMSIIVLILRKIVHLRREVHSGDRFHGDAFNKLTQAAAEVVPGAVAYAMATELALFYYGFGAWKKPELTSQDFTCHRKSGTVAILSILLMMIAVEASAVHFLLIQWSAIATWILTGLSIYTGLQIIGMTRSLTRRYISVESNQITLRYGIMAEVCIPIDQILSFEPSTRSLDSEPESVLLSPLAGIEKHNFVISLKVGAQMRGLYGVKKRFSTIGFYVDDVVHLNKTLKSIHACRSSDSDQSQL